MASPLKDQLVIIDAFKEGYIGAKMSLLARD